MTGQTEIKQRIWRTLDTLRATTPFQIGDSKLLELIAATKETEKLDSILSDAKRKNFTWLIQTKTSQLNYYHS